MLANHGRLEKYNHEFEGRNSRLDGIQAAILSVKLAHLDEWNDQRIKIANKYIENLKDITSLTLPLNEPWAKSVYHLFVIRTERIDELQKYLKINDIETGIHYPLSLPKLKAYAYMDQGKELFYANVADKTLLSLPIGEHLSDQDCEKVINKIGDFFK